MNNKERGESVSEMHPAERERKEKKFSTTQ